MNNSVTTPSASLGQYAEMIANSSIAEITVDPTIGGRLVIARGGNVTVSYAPFEPLNSSATVVLCGITPGRRQAVEALLEARRQLLLGRDVESAARAAKNTASFAGSMRSNIARMLDHVGLHKKLSLLSTLELFGAAAGIVHYTSALRYPVFVDGKDYGGSSPAMLSSPLLTSQILGTLAEEARALPDALWVPLGPKVDAALRLLAARDILDPSHILSGLPHASGANAERIAYFLGTKLRSELSIKTEPDRIDAGRETAMAVVATYMPRAST